MTRPERSSADFCRSKQRQLWEKLERLCNVTQSHKENSRPQEPASAADQVAGARQGTGPAAGRPSQLTARNPRPVGTIPGRPPGLQGLPATLVTWPVEPLSQVQPAGERLLQNPGNRGRKLLLGCGKMKRRVAHIKPVCTSWGHWWDGCAPASHGPALQATGFGLPFLDSLPLWKLPFALFHLGGGLGGGGWG